MLAAVQVRAVREAVRRRIPRRRALAAARRARRATALPGPTTPTYVRNPPFLEDVTMEPSAAAEHRRRARAGPARRQHHDRSHFACGVHQEGQSGGKYLMAHGVPPADFNSYGARRGNHEVMMRGTFANTRLRNQVAPGTEGGFTDVPAGYRGDADLRRRDENTRTPVSRCSSSRARNTGRVRRATGRPRGTLLLGVKAVIAGELRAYSPEQPGQHGCAAAAVPGRASRRPRSA